MSIRKGGQIIAGTPTITTGHHVGEIFYTSRLGIEINGAVEANGSIYNVEGYKGNESVPELLRKGELPHVSMEEYNRIIEEYGSCRAWGWDNGDTFRVPTAEKMKRVLVAKKEATATDQSWYNLYSDGWLEQGGYVSAPASIVDITVTYLKPFIDGNHYFNRTAKDVKNYGNNYASYWSGAFGKTSTGCAFRSESSTWCSGFDWYACGYGAIPTEAEYQFQNIETHRAMVQLTTGVTEDATQLKEYKFNNPFFFGMSIWSEVTPSNGSWLISNGNFHSGKRYVDYYKWLNDIKSDNKAVDGVSVKSVDDEYTDYDWIINTSDTTFRLPLKTKLASGSAVVGNGMTVGLTDGAATFGLQTNASGTSLIGDAGSYGKALPSGDGGSTDIAGLKCVGITTDPDKSGIETSSNGLNLYFYVGDTLQDTNLIQTGEILDYFSKIRTVHCVVETFESGSSWYRVYDDGWVEQGGRGSTANSTTTITLLKPYRDTNYSVTAGNNTSAAYASPCACNIYSNSQIQIRCGGSVEWMWQACGYGA